MYNEVGSSSRILKLVEPGTARIKYLVMIVQVTSIGLIDTDLNLRFKFVSSLKQSHAVSNRILRRGILAGGYEPFDKLRSIGSQLNIHGKSPYLS
jgi:hypothetical protein